MQEAQFFPTFKKSQNYIKLLAELDLLKEGNTKAEEESKHNLTLPTSDISFKNLIFYFVSHNVVYLILTLFTYNLVNCLFNV